MMSFAAVNFRYRNSRAQLRITNYELRIKIVALDRKVWYNVSAADEAEIHDKEQ